jgi:cation-dependent mannose-6-phosphate receptor
MAHRQQNSELVFRGSKLVLNYTNGSPCDDNDDLKHKRSSGFEHDTKDISTTQYKGRRKSTIISLLCQKDALPTTPKVSVAFVGASQDHCTYFFEARSTAACAGIETTQSQLSPGGVFGVM